jgi:hypothetical protein
MHFPRGKVTRRREPKGGQPPNRVLRSMGAEKLNSLNYNHNNDLEVGFDVEVASR